MKDYQGCLGDLKQIYNGLFNHQLDTKSLHEKLFNEVANVIRAHTNREQSKFDDAINHLNYVFDELLLIIEELDDVEINSEFKDLLTFKKRLFKLIETGIDIAVTFLKIRYDRSLLRNTNNAIALCSGDELRARFNTLKKMSDRDINKYSIEP